LVADQAQALYRRGFTVPLVEDGWTQAELVTNCRNTYGIARLLRAFLNGAPVPRVRPESVMRWREADDVESAVNAVRDELVCLELEERDSGGILVVTVGSSLRDVIRERLGLLPWELRDHGSVVCETVHRVKGLEADTVLFVSSEVDVDDMLLYVGVSRAVSELIVIGPPVLAKRLQLDTLSD
jgi:hypothetical protein